MELTITLFTSRQVMARQEDAFGQLKIPRFEALKSAIGDGGWKDVPSELEPEDYSSMMGLPVLGVPRNIDTRFNLESSYLSASCQPFARLPYSLDRPRPVLDHLSDAMKFNFTTTDAAELMPGTGIPDQPKSFRTFFFDTEGGLSLERLNAYLGLESVSASAKPDAELAVLRRLIFGILSFSGEKSGNEQINISISNCTLRETRVESAAHCRSLKDGGGCSVKRQRLSHSDKRPPSVTMFDYPTLVQSFARHLSILYAGNLRYRSPIYKYLIYANGTNKVASEEGTLHSLGLSDISSIPVEVVSERLSLLLNTLHISLLLSNEHTPRRNLSVFDRATAPMNDTALFARPSREPLANEDALRHFLGTLNAAVSDALRRGMPFVPAATTATTSVHALIYVCSFGWMATLLLASAALLAVGAVSLALQLRCTLAPDMLRYVASMTYANAHFRTPPGGSALDGVERAKLLRNVRVRIGDIRGGDSHVGEVAFVAVDEVETRELERKRHYA
jgi:hypothetical protein